MIFITGSGRSGTSILARILRECGGKFGEKVRWYGTSRAGLEDAEFSKLNRHIGPRCYKLNRWLSMDFMLSRAKEIRDEINLQPDRIDFVKDPRLSKTLEAWIKIDFPIDLVIICLRDVWDSANSAKRADRAYGGAPTEPLVNIYADFMARIGNIYYLVNKYNIPHVSVMYPDDYIGDEPLKELGRYVNHKIDEKKLASVCKKLFKQRKYE